VAVPNVPLGLGPPNNLYVTILSGSTNLDLTTVTGVVLTVVKTLTGAVSQWNCGIQSGATSTQLVAIYAFQQPAASGTFNVVNGQYSVPTTVPNVVPAGSLIWFSSQPGIFYTVSGISSTNITLSTPYTGTTNAAATATYTMDVNVLGIYDIAVSMTAPGGTVPGYSIQLQATLPQQTGLRNP
jgi:hypothetical protein